MSPKKATKAAKAKDAKTAAPRNRDYDVVLRPIVTEKSTTASEQNKVIFAVAEDANKQEIKAAVEAIFGVKVKSVNTLIREGKRKGFRGVAGKRADMKKAIVTLAEGQNIDFAAGAR